MYEYENGFSLTQELTLSNSFDGEYEVMHGTNSAVMLRGSQAWMYKEADAPLIGWGIRTQDASLWNTRCCIVMMPYTLGRGKNFIESPLIAIFYSPRTGCNRIKLSASRFSNTFEEADAETLANYLADQLGSTNSLLPAADATAGYQANVIALKANEAVMTGKRVEIKPEDLTV